MQVTTNIPMSQREAYQRGYDAGVINAIGHYQKMITLLRRIADQENDNWETMDARELLEEIGECK